MKQKWAASVRKGGIFWADKINLGIQGKATRKKNILSMAAVRQFWRAPSILVEFMELRVRTVGRPSRQPFISLK